MDLPCLYLLTVALEGLVVVKKWVESVVYFIIFRELPYKDIRYFIERCVEITERPVLDPVPSPPTTYPGEPWVYLVNSMLDEGMKLNYSKDLPPKLRTKKAAIVVGGNILSRGLTLEGLCVSLYSRSASDEKRGLRYVVVTGEFLK